LKKFFSLSPIKQGGVGNRDYRKTRFLVQSGSGNRSPLVLRGEIVNLLNVKKTIGGIIVRSGGGETYLEKLGIA